MAKEYVDRAALVDAILEYTAKNLLAIESPTFRAFYELATLHALDCIKSLPAAALDPYSLHYENLKAEIIREFADQLKSEFGEGWMLGGAVKALIDRIVKEATD